MKTIKTAIRNEIRWCKEFKGTSGKGKDFEAGFIKGLRQAGLLVESVKKLEPNPPVWCNKNI